MLEILEELKQIEKLQIPAVLCIVISTSGSTPRKAGSKMIVFQDAQIKGTIGGGSIEKQVILEAVSMINTGTPVQVRKFNLLDDLKMQCGGSMEVYLEPISCRPRLFIFGGGHIGKALAGYAAGLGFHAVVVDPRPGIFENQENQGIETRNGDYFEMIDDQEFTSDAYFVIVTHQHESDEKLLHYCAHRKFAYLGMIGSKRKVGEISKRAIQEGKLTPEILARIDMPVGIPFAAETPAEIAISIIAKMIDVKNTRKKS